MNKAINKTEVENEIARIEYMHLAGTTLTVCAVVMRNGFVCTGESACVTPSMFNAAKGREIAHGKAFSKAWEHMAYSLMTEIANTPVAEEEEVNSDSVDYDWMEEATAMAAQCWCEIGNARTTMDPELCQSFARKLSAWMSTAAQNQRNTDFYRDLLDQCAPVLGKEVYTADDGSISDEPLRLKIPEVLSMRLAVQQ